MVDVAVVQNSLARATPEPLHRAWRRAALDRRHLRATHSPGRRLAPKFAARALSNWWTVRAEDDGMSYGSPVDRGRPPLLLEALRVNAQSELTSHFRGGEL